MKSGLIPTRRAVVDLNRACNARCLMCYYAHDENKWSKSLDEVKRELDAARERGNTSVDFTGGEPTIYPYMDEAVGYAESIGLHTCIITNGLALDRIRRLTRVGCREWLVSIHAYESKHDELLQVPGAWEKVNAAVDYLNEAGCFLRVNTTLTCYNAEDLPRLARFFLDRVNPRIVNFINFNPHYRWGEQDQPRVLQELNRVQVKVSHVAPYLKEALDILNDQHLQANVRYFPFCALRGYEAHICNNPQVMFDPYEWDYGVSPKTPEAYLEYGRRLQENVCARQGPCAECGVVDVCGGVHRNYAKLHGWDELKPYREKSDDPYYFKTDLEADIIIPVYEPGPACRRLLQEIVEKSVPPYNLIMVSRRQSAARNRNAGLDRSRSPYVIMCDDDIEDLPSGWNRELIRVLRENRDVLAVSARLMNPDGKPGPNSANNFDMSSPLVRVSMIPTACCIFRKTDLRFDERFIRAGWEDTDFFTQMEDRGGGVFAVANTVRVVHKNEEKNRGGAGNRHNQALFYSKWQGKIRLARETDQGSADPQVLNREIRRCLEEGQVEAALPLLDQAFSMGLMDAEMFNNLGFACWELGEKEKALECFYEALLRDPGHKEALDNLVDASGALSSYDHLTSWLEKRLEALPRDPHCLFLLAHCETLQGKSREAAVRLKTLLSIHPDYPGARELALRLLDGGKDESEEKVSVSCPSMASGTRKESPELDLSMFNRGPFLTRRGCIDVGHICDIDCLFCYHRFEERKGRRFLPKEEIMARLRRDREKFDIRITDFTGGEPTLHPAMEEIVRFGASVGNRICLITHGQWRDEERILGIIEAGVYEFLISLHGVEEDHDRVTSPGAFEKVMRNIELLERHHVPWRVNCVAHALNMERLGRYASMISSLAYPPYNANFIVFSPLAGWRERGEIDFQAQHSQLAPHLAEALEVFNKSGIWANVRYYPLCLLEGLQQHVTCFPQICYDPFEWDYRSYANLGDEVIEKVYRLGKATGVYAETEANLFHNTWSIIQSQRCYRKGPQCAGCRMRLICDGVACQYRERFGVGELQESPGEPILDPIHFRRGHPSAVGGSHEIARGTRAA
ncbi:MAG: radical SAM protein [Deltaproteobacteria bacterium]|nr:radical SAM protein [Deltaproteobacteria bacterium]